MTQRELRLRERIDQLADRVAQLEQANRSLSHSRNLWRRKAQRLQLLNAAQPFPLLNDRRPQPILAGNSAAGGRE